MKKTITITGMHCGSCKALIEDVAGDVPGVVSCTLDMATGKTDVEYTDTLNWDDLKKEIEAAGAYRVTV